MIKEYTGNLFNTSADIIAHQVNCQGAMKSGVALQIRKGYPMAYVEYKTLCSAVKPENLLGQLQIVYCGNKLVANLFGQLDYGYGGKKYTDVDALRNAFQNLHDSVKERGFSIAIPYKLGCDRGGANWENEVYPMLSTIFNDEIVLEIWKLPEGVNENEL